MPVTLRKRKAPEPAPAPPPKKAATPKAKKAAAPKKAAPAPAIKKADAPAATVAGKKVAVGDVIDIDSFGGEIETNDGKKTSLKALLDDSKSGVVLFTYPKASTPGCKYFLSCFAPGAFYSLHSSLSTVRLANFMGK